jgi:hypothetical protein
MAESPKAFTPAPALDTSELATRRGFVDVLYALVASSILTVVVNHREMLGAAGDAHLALAGLVVVTSWVGYHNSADRLQECKKLLSIGFAQLAVDLLLLSGYAALVVTTDNQGGWGQSALPQTILLSLVFLGFVAWDLLSRGGGWNHLTATSATFLGVMLAVLVVVLVWRPDGPAVIAADCVLAAVVIVYRFF